MKTAIDTAVKKSPFAISVDDFKQLTKVGLALSVVFSSVAGYLLGADKVSFTVLCLLSFGGYLMVGASNAFNQVIEKDLDALMKRTQNRPVASGRMSVSFALTIAILFTIGGVFTLYIVNPKTAMFGAISIFLYTCVYTPLKTKTPLAVFAGAFPGAIPFMLGWVAATNDFGIEPGTLFMIQFFWQFPHFWAIAWLLDDDYKLAGFKMLPTGKRDGATVLQIIMYTIWMILASVFPVTGLTGDLHLSVPAAVLVAFLGMIMLYFAFRLYNNSDKRTARNLMLASVIYISLMQIIYVVDKFLS
ncbi:heme o synthase [Robertkochia solimangrovi]|uniref:heme o synthase n=1 Tax=Robertkochia solimangrovi TaxID=2213046 RepID=UPI001180A02C|nr:heme o synthase [Robertkochia solimangrovi]TRZ45779.1 protoheme IX farnesyltransferase [Robertkochia solimangrovi]